jgi:hypothetical protein
MRLRNVALGLALLGSVATLRAAVQAPQRQEPTDKSLKFEVVSVRPNRDTTALGMINTQGVARVATVGAGRTGAAH